MVSESRVASDSGRGGARRLLATAGILAVVALAAVSCGGDDDFEKSSEGFNIEPAGEVGPHAFTPSVATGDTQNALGAGGEGESAQGAPAGACDTEKFLQELQKRPDAYREWGRVLGIPASELPAYIRGLKSAVLSKDTKVTNHGLKDGRAYPRQSVLTAGTAVLVDGEGGASASTTTLALPPGTAPGGGVVVTRCKCGNPLLPPGDPKAPESSLPPATESPGTGTSEPGTIAPRSTRPGTTAPGSTSRPSTTTAGSSTTGRSGNGGTATTVDD
jgi:hypothetical protein